MMIMMMMMIMMKKKKKIRKESGKKNTKKSITFLWFGLITQSSVEIGSLKIGRAVNRLVYL